MSEPKCRDEEWLREQYVEKGRTVSDIAALCNCDAGRVRTWVDRYFSLRDGEPKYHDEEWLREWYIHKGAPMQDIANRCGCSKSTINKWLDKYGIDTRGAGSTPQILKDEEWLREKYIDHEMNILEIAEEADCSKSAVARWLGRHEIQTRSPRVVNLGENNHNWQGGPAPYGPGWNDKKKSEVRERDGYTCQDPRCSVTQTEHMNEYGKKLHVHHLRKARDVDDPEERNATENLITLCCVCHKRWEKIADTGLVPQLDAGEIAD